MSLLIRVLAAFVTLCATVSPRANELLPQTIMASLREANIPLKAIGVVVVPIGPLKSAPIVAFNHTKPMQPASTLKLVTSAVALENLGPTSRSKAQLLTTLRRDELSDTLDTPLVLRGEGSPDLTIVEFKVMLQQLRAGGLRNIRGDLVLDRSWLNPQRPDLGTPDFDESPELRYNFIPDSISLGMNLSSLSIQSGSTKLEIKNSPTLEGVEIFNNLVLIDAPCNRWEDLWQKPLMQSSGKELKSITLVGEFPKNCTVEAQINLMDRTNYADKLFRSLWQELGGSYSGKTREITANDLALSANVILSTHQSRPLAAMILDVNKRSDNPITRLLYLKLGTAGKSIASADQSDIAVRNWFRSKGIDDLGMVLENGSGLSRTERVTAYQLAAVLAVTYDSRWAPEFLASLPIIGLDGSMRNRLKTGVAAQRGRIKTGSLKDVWSIAGYVTDIRQQTYAVVAMINDPNATTKLAQPILDKIIEWVASGANQ